MIEVLEGLDGVFVFMDDILVYGKNATEHANRLTKVLHTLDKAGLKLNREKCTFRQSELPGHVFSQEGMRVDPDKVEAILQMEPPKNVPEL